MNARQEYRAAWRTVRLRNSTEDYHAKGRKFTEEKSCVFYHLWIYILAEQSFLTRTYR